MTGSLQMEAVVGFSFCHRHQFQHLYTLTCNWAEIGANMSERCRNLMIIKVITRPGCLIRRVLFPTLILWRIIRPGHCCLEESTPNLCLHSSEKNPPCPNENLKLPPNSSFCWEAFLNATVLLSTTKMWEQKFSGH